MHQNYAARITIQILTMHISAINITALPISFAFFESGWMSDEIRSIAVSIAVLTKLGDENEKQTADHQCTFNGSYIEPEGDGMATAQSQSS